MIKIEIRIKIKTMIENLVKLYSPYNFNNRVVGPPKGKSLEGQPPRYSNQQQKFLKLFIQNNNELLEQENLPTPPLPNSASWFHLHSLQLTLAVHECMYLRKTLILLTIEKTYIGMMINMNGNTITITITIMIILKMKKLNHIIK